MSRIADKNTRIKHFEELIFLNHLCIDLKKALKVGRLVELVNSQAARPQPLRGTLAAAMDSINRNNPISAAHQLLAFQNQVRVQVGHDPALAEKLIQATQDVIEALGAGIK